MVKMKKLKRNFGFMWSVQIYLKVIKKLILIGQPTLNIIFY